MGRLWNRYIRWVMKKISSTGLEQELNQSEVTGELVFPEIAAVARQMAAEGIVLLKTRGIPCLFLRMIQWRYLVDVL